MQDFSRKRFIFSDIVFNKFTFENIWSKSFWIQTHFWSKQIFGVKKIWGPKNLGSKKHFATGVKQSELQVLRIRLKFDNSKS